ncbi:phenylacetate--CoA ligase family protein [Pseudomonas carassii]|uniref:CoF synthetase n=1 Tax=Pseudomonas carassii TaxID=3115855 RepID=A0ABU7HGM9_9PSED|nr:hypothetical protein [Pseudomonas sp. 137P]MEE1890346.1 hypothetical protein [Pseudomonas sp. 137P]
MTTDIALTDTEKLAVARLASQYAELFPWYKQRLVGLAGQIHSLDQLPLIDEATLIDHYYTASHDQLPDSSAYLTSGTATGARKKILYAVDDDEAYLEQRRTLFAGFLRDLPPGSVAVADLGTGHAAASARRIFQDLQYQAHDIDFSRPIEEHIEALNRWQPDVLFTMPMILDRLTQAEQPLDIRPRKIIVVGDVAPIAWRREVAGRFGIDTDDVLDILGSIEIGAIAHYCAETGLYHFHDHILPEVLSLDVLFPYSHAQPSPAGSGILLLTSLTRRYFPALRFVTNDVISGLRVIEWQGRRTYAFDRIEGRHGGEIKHGERISSHDLCEAVAQVFPGAPFEVRNDGQLDIRVVVPQVTASQQEQVRALLAEAAPDVAQMLASGLVQPITVTAIGLTDLKSTNAKRRFNLKGV